MLRLLRKLIGAESPTPAAGRQSATGAVLAQRARARDGAGGRAEAQEFDPYNTGAFNRSASWERIGKRNL